MSRYFETLKRLQSGQPAGSEAAEPLEELERDRGVGSRPFQPVTPPSAKVRKALSNLIESLRLEALSAPSRCVVVAAVSDPGASRRVMAGLEAVAEEKRLELVTGELIASGSDRFVRFHRVGAPGNRETDLEATPVGDATALDLDKVSLAKGLRRRIDQVHPRAELAVLHGPPLADSAEAALLAQATGGLLLVLEPLITRRSDLFLALDRAAHSQCTVLGVVNLSVGSELPSWLGR